jgi:hypothetical protein
VSALADAESLDPAVFWGGVWLWREQLLGFLVRGMILLKAAAEGLTLVAQTGATLLMRGECDPMLPAYAMVGCCLHALRPAVPAGRSGRRAVSGTNGFVN